MSTTIVPDVDLFLNDLAGVVSPETPRELAIFAVDGVGGTKPYAVYTVTSPEQALRWTQACGRNARHRFNTYIGVNPLDPTREVITKGGMGRAKDSDVARIDELYIDLDGEAAHAEGRAMTEAETAQVEAAAAQLIERVHAITGKRAVLRTLSTGRGYSLSFALAGLDPVEHKPLVAKAYTALAALVDAEGVTFDKGVRNVSRIRRVAGTSHAITGATVTGTIACRDEIEPLTEADLTALVEQIDAPMDNAPTGSDLSVALAEGAVVRQFTDEQVDALIELFLPLAQTKGHRHWVALSFAGMLRHKGMTAEAMAEAVRRLYERAGDDEPQDREECIASTNAKFDSSGRVAWRSFLGGVLDPDEIESLSRRISTIVNRVAIINTETGEIVRKGREGAPARRGGGSEQASAADTALELIAPRLVELWHDTHRNPHVSLMTDDGLMHLPITSGEVVSHLRTTYFAERKTTLQEQAAAQAIQTLAARALVEGQAYEVAHRVSWPRESDTILYDPAWEGTTDLIAIRAGCVERVPNECGPVRLVRTDAMLPAPKLVPNPSLDPLWEAFRIPEGRIRQQLALALISGLQTGGTRPILQIVGSGGSGKSTLAEALMNVIDPTKAPLKSTPRNEEAWAIAGSGRRLVGIDNATHFTHEQLNIMCRMTSGQGEHYTRRALYTQAGEATISAYTTLIVTTTADIMDNRDDVAMRLITVNLPDFTGYGTSRSGAGDFDRDRVFTALIGAAQEAVRLWSTIETHYRADMGLPRMADLAVMAECMGPALGFEPGVMVEELLTMQRESWTAIAENSDLLTLLQLAAWDRGGTMVGSASTLRDALLYSFGDTHHADAIPKSPETMGRRLKTLARPARERGIVLEQGRNREWTVRTERAPEAGLGPAFRNREPIETRFGRVANGYV